MKRYAMSTLLLILSFATAIGQEREEVRWRTNYNDAVAEAYAAGLPIFIEAYMTPCPPCRKMEETFKDPVVATILNVKFIPLKLDVSQSQALFNRLGIQSYPSQVYINSTTMHYTVRAGYSNPVTFTQHLREALSR